MDNRLAILLITCDEYSDLWKDFFTLKDKYWADCDFPTYLVNNSMPFNWPGVNVINCGDGVKWSTRVRHALSQVEADYVIPILEDHLISNKVDNRYVKELFEYVIKNNVDYLAFENKRVILPETKWQKVSDFVVVPNHLKYGVDTAAAIWKKEFYGEKIGQGDYTAWQFEVNMCNDAISEKGLGGYILWDPNNALSINEIEVVRQGKFRPEAIVFFKNIGYDLDTSHRPVMTKFESFKDNFKGRFARIKFGRRFIKRIAKIFGYKFFTKD